MRDRNEAAPDAAGADIAMAESLNKTTNPLTEPEKLEARNAAIAIPIGLVPLIKVVKIRKTSRRAHIFKLGVHTKTMMAWKPKELHRFWRRMLGEDLR